MLKRTRMSAPSIDEVAHRHEATPTWQRRDPVAIDAVQYQSWCADRLAEMMAEPVGVQAAAAAGIVGPASPLPHGDVIQSSFGSHDVRDVNAHVGGAARHSSELMGANAYAVGKDVAFASQPDLHLAAHEAAHVVQQRGGVQLNGGVGQAVDSYEEHADRVADAVVRGESAAPILDAVPRGGATSPTAVQRHTESEHQAIGNAASGDQRIEFPNGVSLKFGAVVAMAGDYFGGPQELYDMVMRPGPGPGTISEVQYVLVQIERDRHAQRVHHAASERDKAEAQADWQTTVDREDGYSAETKKAVDDRFLRLARNNEPHFVDPDGTGKVASRVSSEEWAAYLHGGLPGSAPKGYRLNHINAIRKAQEAGRDGTSIDLAMFYEAFGAHYLTDAFAGGHARTPRRALKTHYNALSPMFYENVVGFMAEQIAEVLEKETYFGLPSEELVFDGGFGEKGAYETLRKTFDETGGMSFGDVMSGVLHDYDNEHGVRAMVDGQRVTLKGDGHLDEGDQYEAATKACAVGILDVETAYAMGQSEKSVTEIYESLTGPQGGLFAVETMLPQVLPDAQQGDEQHQLPTHATSIEALLRDPQFREGLATLFREKASMIEGSLQGFDAPKRAAVNTRIIRRMRGGPEAAAALLRDIVDWVPDTGGGLFGHEVESNALAYIANARRIAGGMQSLTYTQREKLIGMLKGHGVAGSPSSRAIDELLSTAPVADREKLIEQTVNAPDDDINHYLQ